MISFHMISHDFTWFHTFHFFKLNTIHVLWHAMWHAAFQEFAGSTKAKSRQKVKVQPNLVSSELGLVHRTSRKHALSV